MALFWAFSLVITGAVAETKVDISSSRQLILCLAPTETSSEGMLQRFDRNAAGDWVATGEPWRVMLGRGGLAWGHGLQPENLGVTKTTGDRKTPMGLFRIGQALGYAKTLPEGNKGWPYHQVTDRDAWIDDPTLPNYNHLYTLPEGAPQPIWWEKERMHLDDFAYNWLLVIEHNYSDTPDLNGGNAIFFHIRRGDHYRTAGCTTMEQASLEKILTWLEPGSAAVVATLTIPEYQRVRESWGLPPTTSVPERIFHQPPEPKH